MRLVLIYPPPWKIPPPGLPPYPPGEGAPVGTGPLTEDAGDFSQAPYGLLSIGAQAIAAGHKVAVLNLSTLPWKKVQGITDHLQADLYGLSCHTANRRGVAMLAEWVRRCHPAAHIVVGGPHVTALPRETLEHYAAIDTVVVGEGEATFMELVGRIEAGDPAVGIPGTAWRGSGGVQVGPARPPIADLDALASPADHFPLRTLITSRGCPGRCTYCASRSMWGGRLRFHSADFVVRMVAAAVYRHGYRYLAFKDDTFTADRERTVAICEEITRRGIGCCWSCETRADRLDEDLLRVMRRAGCRRISLGVESASPVILKNIRKNISPAAVLAATAMARRYGVEVRYYMMVGNRGETYRTFRQSLAFIEKARPNQFVFCQLHLYPGTEEFEIFRRHGSVTAEIFFSRDFAYLTCFAGHAEDLQKILPELRQIAGVRDFHTYGIDTCEAALEELPGLAAAQVDLCVACLHEGDLERARACFEAARRLGSPLPGLLSNLEACLAAATGDYRTALACLEKAAVFNPHGVAVQNLSRLRDWLSLAGGDQRQPPELVPGNAFETHAVAQQPEGPGALPGACFV